MTHSRSGKGSPPPGTETGGGSKDDSDDIVETSGYALQMALADAVKGERQTDQNFWSVAVEEYPWRASDRDRKPGFVDLVLERQSCSVVVECKGRFARQHSVSCGERGRRRRATVTMPRSAARVTRRHLA